MKKDEILSLPSMPIQGGSYPKGPYRFINREYLIITYETEPGLLRQIVPEPLEPNPDNLVAYEFINMPDSSGFGSYSESGCVIPCTFNGEAVNFTAQMYLNDEAPLAAGREIWGFPKKNAEPKLEVVRDTLTGTLHYGGHLVAMGTMGYKHENLSQSLKETTASLGKTQINLKLIPGIDGKPQIAELVAYNMTDITVKGCWGGPARLHLVPHVNAPLADFPVKRIVSGKHVIADMTLPYGRLLHDYLK